MKRRIPVYIITGFLGSGKTTLLKQMVDHAKSKGQNPAILMNELGSENVERHLFQGEEMIELLDGCICCTIQDDMKEELITFLDRENEIDVLFIEGTGIANPIDIVEALTHPLLINKVEIYNIIGVVDTSRYLEYQSIFQSSKEIRTMLKDQVKSSSLLLLNKADLISKKETAKVTTKIEGIKQDGVELIVSSFGDVSMDLLLSKQMTTQNWTNDPIVVTHHHHHPFQAIKIEHALPVGKRAFETWLKSKSSLLRAKGYIVLKKENKLYSFQFASGELHLKEEVENVEPCVILIGAGLDPDIASEFKQLEM